MKKTKNIEMKGNFLNIRKDFLINPFTIFIAFMLLIGVVVFVIGDNSFIKAMNEIYKAEV